MTVRYSAQHAPEYHTSVAPNGMTKAVHQVLRNLSEHIYPTPSIRRVRPPRRKLAVNNHRLLPLGPSVGKHQPMTENLQSPANNRDRLFDLTAIQHVVY